MTQATRIKITDVSKIYQSDTKTVEAVKNFSESVQDGEFVCVVGASGCGKTTLLWCLSGLHPATSGTVHIDGELLTKPLPDRIGMVFQDSNLLPWRTLMENIELPFQIKKKPVNRELVDELLEVAGLKGFENSYPGELSGGMKQRVGIARAFAIEPKMLLLDEPFGALDALTRGVIQDELLKICKETNQTVFMITHDVDEAILLSDKIMLMSNGPNARIAEIVVNTLPKGRKRANLHHDAMYYPMRNHLVDFLVNRSKDLQIKGAKGELDGYKPIIVLPGVDAVVA